MLSFTQQNIEGFICWKNVSNVMKILSAGIHLGVIATPFAVDVKSI
jgi:hypothetical protein